MLYFIVIFIACFFSSRLCYFNKIMKDLKHYFSSPQTSEGKKGTVTADVPNNSVQVLDDSVNANTKRKKKTSSKESKKKIRKRKLGDDETYVSDDFVEDSLEKKKRKKSTLAFKVATPNGNLNGSVPTNRPEPSADNFPDGTPKGQKRSKSDSLKIKRSRESGSSKENSTESDAEDKVQTPSENCKNLFSYFNKVDKLPDLCEKPIQIKVEVLVHADSSGSPPNDVKKKPSVKKRKSTKKNSVVDFDLITTEEIPSGTNCVDNLKNSVGENFIVTNKSSAVEVCKPSPTPDGFLKADVIAAEPEENSGRECKFQKCEKDNCVSSDIVILLDDEVCVENKESKPKQKIKHDEKENCVSSDIVILLDDEVGMENKESKPKQKIKHDGTLASFFNVGSSKPAALEKKTSSAKLQFLMSSAPQPIKRAMATINIEGKIAPFPTKSHLQQKDKMNILWNLSDVKLNFKTVGNDVIETPKWCSALVNNITRKACIKKEISSEQKCSLKELKKELNLFPISCWVKELKRMKKGNKSLMWTERYKPHSSSSFLANSRSISRLKAWLVEMKESSIADSGASSGDEFVKDKDDERRLDRKTIVLLSGPPGVGKTASVYAIAEEIGYNVLEINASSNRSGRKILNEFSEAMKSHKVNISKLNFSKGKKQTEDPKRSLILIEDADLLFEDDEGFVPTLMNMGALTKRPIILVANNHQAKHFTKLQNLFHATLQFVPPTHDRLSSWLRTVSLVEGFHLSAEDSMKLASLQDMRKCLLQLQLTQTNSEAFRKEDDDEKFLWDAISELDLSSKEGRKKALTASSALANLDVIRMKKRHREIPPYWHKPLEDSTLNHESQTLQPHRLDGIEAALLGLVSSTDPLPSNPQFSYYEIPRNLLEVEKDVCSMTSILSKRSLSLDYWPVLRQICRAETARLATHTKRNNRYFNYLSSLGAKGPPDLCHALSSSFS